MAKTYGTISYYGKLFEGTSITPEIARAAERTRRFGLDVIEKRTPVRTGKLKSGWKAQLEGNGIRWSNDTEYGIFLEMGTRNMKPRAMLRKSLPKIEQKFREELGKEIGRKLAGNVIRQARASRNIGYDEYINQTPQRGGLNPKAFVPTKRTK